MVKLEDFDMEFFIQRGITNHMMIVAGTEAVDAIMRETDTPTGWPYDTGLSSASFDFQLSPDSRSSVDEVHITNDTDYAFDVEELYEAKEGIGRAAQTLERNLPDIAQKVLDAFVEEL